MTGPTEPADDPLTDDLFTIAHAFYVGDGEEHGIDAQELVGMLTDALRRALVDGQPAPDTDPVDGEHGTPEWSVYRYGVRHQDGATLWCYTAGQVQSPHLAKLVAGMLNAQIPPEHPRPATPGPTREQVAGAIGQALNASQSDIHQAANRAADAVLSLFGSACAPPATTDPYDPAELLLCPKSFALYPENHVTPVPDAEGWGACVVCGQVLNIQGKQIPQHEATREVIEGDSGCPTGGRGAPEPPEAD